MQQPVSIQQLERDLRDARNAAEAISYTLTDGIEREVAELNGRLAVAPPSDQDHFKALIEKALARLDATRAANAEKARLNGKVLELETALSVAQAEQRSIAIEQSNRNVNEARSEYLHACKAVVRAWRRLLQLQRVAQATPGADRGMPGGFHLAALWPMSWQAQAVTATSDHMRDSALPCEQSASPNTEVGEVAA